LPSPNLFDSQSKIQITIEEDENTPPANEQTIDLLNISILSGKNNERSRDLQVKVQESAFATA